MSTSVIPCPTCGADAPRQFAVTDASRIRITDGFRVVTASMVCEEFRRSVWPRSPDPPKPRWVGGFGHPAKE